MSWQRLLLAIAVLLTIASGARAQLAATVPSEDPVYELLTEAADYLGTRAFVIGQRPMSRRQIATLLSSMNAELDRRGSSDGSRAGQRIRELVSAMMSAYEPDLRALRDSAGATVNPGMPLEAVMFDALGTNSHARRIPSDSLGGIDAYTNPLTDGRWGRPIADDGVTFDVETSHRVGIGDALAFGAQPRATWLQSRSGTSALNLGVQRLYARGVWHNVALEAGLDEHLWGLAGNQGMLLSANPRPLHAVSVSNDTAITLPWWFGIVGPIHAVFLAADLGQNRNFPGSKLFAYQISARPTSRFEWDAGLVAQIGGEGAPAASLSTEVGTVFPMVLWIVKAGTDTVHAAHAAQFQMRYVLSRSLGLSASYELDLTDFDTRRRKGIFTQEGSHFVGLTAQELAGGRIAANVRYTQTSLRQGEHYQYMSGMTYDRRLFGTPLGPNAKAGYGTLTWRYGLMDDVSIDAAYESREASKFLSTTPTGALIYRKLSQGPRENRTRVLVAGGRAALKGFSAQPVVGVEHVENLDFAAGVTKNQAIVELRVSSAF